MPSTPLLRFLEFGIDDVFARVRALGRAVCGRARSRTLAGMRAIARLARAGLLVEGLRQLVRRLLEPLGPLFDLRRGAVLALAAQVVQRALDVTLDAAVELVADFFERLLGRVDEARGVIADLGLFLFAVVFG